MLIRELVQSRLKSNFKLFNREGNQVELSRILKEYQAIRQYLLDHHSKANDCIAIKQKKDYLYFLTILACQEIGITYIPMKHDYPMDRVDQIQKDSNFSLLISDEEMAKILNYKDQIITDLPQISSETNAYIIFTSGSTGRPKGVVIQRKALQNFYSWANDYFSNVTDKDRLLQVTEFTFDISLLDIGLFLTKNIETYFSNWEGNIFKLGFEIETHRISALNTVPNNLNMFLSDLVAERMDYKCLKFLFIAGSRFSHGLYEKCLKYFPEPIEVYNLYGPTESTVYSHGKKFHFVESLDCKNGNVSIGTPLPNVFSAIVIDNKSVNPGESGELLLGGIQLLKEYSNNPEQTASAIVEFEGNRYYKSGDLAFMDEKGDYFIVGRNDDTIKYRGFRINLLDIDSYITRVPYVQDSVTVAIEDSNAENLTIGFIILREQKNIKELKKDLGALLLDYQIPEKIIFVDKFPVNVSGKVCKNTLKAQYLESLNKVKND
jgi:D-alanine--poly(phosphoribitol) ligase subunit 1